MKNPADIWIDGDHRFALFDWRRALIQLMQLVWSAKPDRERPIRLEAPDFSLRYTVKAGSFEIYLVSPTVLDRQVIDDGRQTLVVPAQRAQAIDALAQLVHSRHVGRVCIICKTGAYERLWLWEEGDTLQAAVEPFRRNSL